MDKSKWEYKKLGEVATFLNGYAFKPENWSKHGLKIIRIQNLTDETAPYNCYDGDIDPKYIVRNGDLLISWSATLGAFLWNNDDALLNQHIFKTIFDKSDIDKYYLKYCVISKLEEMAKKSHGVTMRHITKKDFDNTIISYPSLSDQQRIVAELDCLNKMIAVKQEQLKEFDKLAQSIFYDMFGDPVSNEKGWKQCLLKDVSKTITDGDHMPPPKSDSGVPFVTISNVDKDTRQIDFSSTFYVPRDYYDNIPESKKPQVGDVLYTVTGSYGIPILIKEEKEFCFQRHIGLIRPNKDIEPTFLCMWAGCHSVKNYADRYATGVAQKTVSLKVLRNFPIIVPHLSLQQQFADKISAIEAQKELVKQSIAETKHLLDYTMDKYFG